MLILQRSNGFIVASDDSSAKVVPLMPSADTKATFPDPASTPAMLQSYYYTESGSYTASVTPSGVGVKAAKTTFSVAAPTTTLAAKYQYATRTALANGGPDPTVPALCIFAFGAWWPPEAPGKGAIDDGHREPVNRHVGAILCDEPNYSSTPRRVSVARRFYTGG